MPSPEDRPPGHHRVVNAATIPIASQRRAVPAPGIDYEPPTRPNPIPRPGPVPRQPLRAPANQGRWAPNQPPPQFRPPQPQFRPPQPQFRPPPPGTYAPAEPRHPLAHPSDPLYADVPRITTTQRPRRRVDTSVLCAAAALVLLGVAVLVGLML